jgi:YebC/PmpR family DNA-binding regulatory protein
MGRHFEVRAASMASTAKKKSALYMRASKEIYVAAKSGLPDPESNLALRSAIDKYKGQSVPKDVIERAIKRVSGDDQKAYVAGRYEALGPGGSLLVIDTLSDNPNRAFIDIRTTVNKHGGHLGNVLYNFIEIGLIVYKGDNEDKVTEALILQDVDLKETTSERSYIEIQVTPSDLNKAKTVLNELNISELTRFEIVMIAQQEISLNEEDNALFFRLLDALDELDDVQAVYHNVQL